MPVSLVLQEKIFVAATRTHIVLDDLVRGLHVVGLDIVPAFSKFFRNQLTSFFPARLARRIPFPPHVPGGIFDIVTFQIPQKPPASKMLHVDAMLLSARATSRSH